MDLYNKVNYNHFGSALSTNTVVSQLDCGGASVVAGTYVWQNLTDDEVEQLVSSDVIRIIGTDDKALLLSRSSDGSYCNVGVVPDAGSGLEALFIQRLVIDGANNKATYYPNVDIGTGGEAHSTLYYAATSQVTKQADGSYTGSLSIPSADSQAVAYAFWVTLVIFNVTEFPVSNRCVLALAAGAASYGDSESREFAGVLHGVTGYYDVTLEINGSSGALTLKLRS